jgi:hypothetical protein
MGDQEFQAKVLREWLAWGAEVPKANRCTFLPHLQTDLPKLQGDGSELARVQV